MAKKKKWNEVLNHWIKKERFDVSQISIRIKVITFKLKCPLRPFTVGNTDFILKKGVLDNDFYQKHSEIGQWERESLIRLILYYNVISSS